MVKGFPQPRTNIDGLTQQAQSQIFINDSFKLVPDPRHAIFSFSNLSPFNGFLFFARNFIPVCRRFVISLPTKIAIILV